jgi:phosphoglucosamine mutase
VTEGRKVSDVCNLFDPVPQLLRNVRFNGGAPLESARVIEAIEAGEQALGEGGRLVIRKSGTEPVIRVMAEGDDDALVTRVVGDIAGVIEEAGRT